MIAKRFRSGVAFLAALTSFQIGIGAGAPVASTFEDTLESVITTACGFPIHLTAHLSGTQRLFFDREGALVRVLIHQVEQDVFTANGKTLVSEPYTVSIEVQFDDVGNVTHIFGRGVLLRVPLPGGGQFLSAGVSDYIKHPGEDFVFTPDIGRSGDLDALCAALAP